MTASDPAHDLSDPVEAPVVPQAVVDPHVEWDAIVTLGPLPVPVGEPGRAAAGVVAARPSPDSVPDTCSDAFRSRSFTVRAASVRGVEHRHFNTPRQDAFSVAMFGDSGLAIAVADGVGSLPDSHLAANEAARTFTGASAYSTWVEIFEASQASVLEVGSDGARRELAGPDEIRTAVASRMATTLTGIRISPDGAGGWVIDAGWIGDCSAWLIRPDQWECITRVKAGVHPTGFLSSRVSALPADDPTPHTSTIAAVAGDVVVVVSDGVGDPLGSGDGELASTLAGWWATPPHQHEFTAQVDFARETFVDDRTCVAVWLESSAAS